MGILDTWFDAVVEKARKIVADEAAPLVEKVDKVCAEVERAASEIKRRSDELVSAAERELEGREVVDAEVDENDKGTES